MTLKIFVSFCIILDFVTCPMAKNIYSDPDLSSTSGKFDTFKIDFKGIKTPFSTYWSLCNWGMDLTDLQKTHSDATGGGAYGGLQTVIDGKTAIISFWEIQYTENGKTQKMRANRIYPPGKESAFGGEGEGNNYISEYNWVTGNWYRFVVHSWKDANTGNTFVGAWIKDITAKKWTLWAYFDTHLKNSYLKGGMSQFQENYYDKYFGEERSFNIKNIYVHEWDTQKWKSLAKVKLSYDPPEWKFNTAGIHEFGYKNDYFWGKSGLPVEDQVAYDAANPRSVTGTISQPSQPEDEAIRFVNMNATLTTLTAELRWQMNYAYQPPCSYTITIKKYENNSFTVVHTSTITRPEATSFTLQSVFKGNYYLTVTANGIFGRSISMTSNLSVS